MLETGLRQFRMVMGMVWGRRLDPAGIAKLVGDAVATLAEFGEPGADVRAVTDGPLADPASRLDFANRAIARTARRLAAQSPFYARRLASAVGEDAATGNLDVEGLRRIPVTTKTDLVDRQTEFLCPDAPGQLATRTTGTTGGPTELWVSGYELALWSGLSALTGVLRDEITPADLFHLHVSSRATLSVQLTTAICRLVGARSRVLGVMPPEQAVELLAEGGATLMSANASYLGELLTAAQRVGATAGDFALHRVDVGGEVLSPTVSQNASDIFGARINDVYSMTEIAPVSASTCSQGHLHPDVNTGWVEVLDLDTGAASEPGQLGTIVVTPYYPYRECMPVLRYDTRDVVRMLPDEPQTCELSGLPGTGPVLGKADQLVRLSDTRIVTPRSIVEALESLPGATWPVRYRAAQRDGRLVLTVPRAVVTPLGERETRLALADSGLDADLIVAADAGASGLRPLRSDLRETTFDAPAPIGA